MASKSTGEPSMGKESIDTSIEDQAATGGAESIGPSAAYQIPAVGRALEEARRITIEATTLERHKYVKQLLATSSKSTIDGRLLRGDATTTATFKMACAHDSGAASAAEEHPSEAVVSITFNIDDMTSRRAPIPSQRQYEVLRELPAHRNVGRLLFECVSYPPTWMVHVLRDPAAACVPSMDADPHAPLVPRKAHIVGTESFPRSMADHLLVLERGEEGSIPEEALAVFALDIAEGMDHLLRHGIVHRDLKLDNVMWDSKGGPEGVGRAVLVSLEHCLSIASQQSPTKDKPSTDDPQPTAASAASGEDPEAFDAAAGGGNGVPPPDCTKAVLDAMTYGGLCRSGDELGGNQAHLAPEVLDGWNTGLAGDDSAAVPFGKQASWALGVLLHELATGGQHPFGPDYPIKLHDGTDIATGRLQEILNEYDPLELHADLLDKRPAWFKTILLGLLQADPAQRLPFDKALRMLRAATAATLFDVSKGLVHGTVSAMLRPLAPVLTEPGPACDDAVSQLNDVLWGVKQTGDHVGLMQLMRVVRLDTGVSCPTKLPEEVKAVLSEARSELYAIFAEPSNKHKLASTVWALTDDSMPPGINHAVLGLWQVANVDKSSCELLAGAGAVPGFMKLLASDQGTHFECAAFAAFNLSHRTTNLQLDLVDNGAVPLLADRVYSEQGRTGQMATGAIRHIMSGSGTVLLAIVNSGSLSYLVGRVSSGGDDDLQKTRGSIHALAVFVNKARSSKASCRARLKDAVLKTGAVPALVGAIHRHDAAAAPGAIDSLEHIVKLCDEHVDLLHQLNACNAVAELVRLFEKIECVGCMPRTAELLVQLSSICDDVWQHVLKEGAIARITSYMHPDADEGDDPAGDDGSACEELTTKELVAGTLVEFATGPEEIKQAIIDAGAVKELCFVLKSSEEKVALQAAYVVSELAGHSEEMCTAVAEYGAFEAISSRLKSRIAEDQTIAAALVEAALGSHCAAPRVALESAGVLPTLVTMLNAGDHKVVRYAAEAVAAVAICIDEDQPSTGITSAGAVPRLLVLLGSDDPDCAAAAGLATARLAAGSEGDRTAMEKAGMLKKCVELLSLESPSALRGHALHCLSYYAEASGDWRQSFVDAGVLPALAPVCKSDDGSRHAIRAIRLIGFTCCGLVSLVDAAKQAGVFTLLAELISDAPAFAAATAARSVWQLAGYRQARAAIVEAGVVQAIAKRLPSIETQLIYWFAMPLLDIAANYEELAEEAAGLGAFNAIKAMLESSYAKNVTFGIRTCYTSKKHMSRHVVAAGVLPQLVFLLASDHEDRSNQAARALAQIAKAFDDTCQAVVDACAANRLVDLLGLESTDDKLRGLDGLGVLARVGDPLRNAAVAAGALDAMVPLLSSKEPALACAAAKTTGLIAEGASDLKQAVADAGAMEPLVYLLRAGATAGSDPTSSVQKAAFALCAMSDGHDANTSAIVKSGVIRMLVAMLDPRRLDVVQIATDFLESFAEPGTVHNDVLKLVKSELFDTDLFDRVQRLLTSDDLEMDVVLAVLTMVKSVLVQAFGGAADAIVKTGLVRTLLKLVKSSDTRVASVAAQLLSSIVQLSPVTSQGAGLLNRLLEQLGSLEPLFESIQSEEPSLSVPSVNAIRALVEHYPDASGAGTFCLTPRQLAGVASLIPGGPAYRIEAVLELLLAVLNSRQSFPEKKLVNVGVVPACVDLLAPNIGKQGYLSAYILSRIADSCDDHAAHVHEAGAGEALVGLLVECDASYQQHVMAAIGSLCKNSKASIDDVVGAGATRALARALQSKDGNIREQAARALFHICYRSPSLLEQVSESGAFASLVEMALSDHGNEAWHAMRVLWSACQVPQLALAVSRLGGIKASIYLLKVDSLALVDISAQLLGCIGRYNEQLHKTLLLGGAVVELGALLDSCDTVSSNEAVATVVEHTTGALLGMSDGTLRMQNALCGDGLPAKLVALVNSLCSDERQLVVDEYQAAIQNSLGVLANLSKRRDAMRDHVIASGGLDAARSMLQLDSKLGVKTESARRLIRNIAAGSERCKQAVVDAKVLPVLVAHIGNEHCEVVLETLCYIAAGPEAVKRAVLDAGAVTNIVPYLDEDDYNALITARTIALLSAGDDSIKTAILERLEDVTGGLVTALGIGGERLAVEAATALGRLSLASDDARYKIIESGAGVALVRIIAADRVSRASPSVAHARLARLRGAAPPVPSANQVAAAAALSSIVREDVHVAELAEDMNTGDKSSLLAVLRSIDGWCVQDLVERVERLGWS